MIHEYFAMILEKFLALCDKYRPCIIDGYPWVVNSDGHSLYQMKIYE